MYVEGRQAHLLCPLLLSGPSLPLAAVKVTRKGSASFAEGASRSIHCFSLLEKF